MGKYPEAEDRDATEITNPDDVVVDLESYRQRRAIAGRDTNANQPPRETGAEGAGARNASIEGDHRS